MQQDWLEDYLDFTSPQEAPEIFHFWSGIAVISSVLNRRVYLPRIAKTGVQYYTNFPGQLSPLLIAGSGKAKKSTAIAIAKSFMKEAGVKIFDGKITPERLLAKLSTLPGKQAIMTAIASELSSFLGKQSYNDGMIDILIKLADCESHPYETQKQVFDLSDTNVCFTLYGASTPIGLSKAIPPQAQEHGFLSRYIWVYSDKSGKIESLANDSDAVDPRLLDASNIKRNSLIVRLRGFASLVGGFRWGASKGWYDAYYQDYMESPSSAGEGWPTRRSDHLVRLAMILHISKGDTNLVLDEQDLIRADYYLSQIEKDMQKCFSFIGQHVNAEHQDKILKVLRENPITNAKDLFFRVLRYFRDPNEVKTTLMMMEDAGIIANTAGNGSAAKYTILKEPY